MKLKPIKTNKEYKAWLDWVDIQFDKKIKPNTPEGEKLQVALMLIKDYEDRHYPIPLPDPVEAVKIKMKEKGLKNKDFIGKLGSKSYVSAILNKKKPMTLEIAKIFHNELGIDAETLLS
jgi:HTH-type transcriptional regulator/antitoxin HigA